MNMLHKEADILVLGKVEKQTSKQKVLHFSICKTEKEKMARNAACV